MIGYPIPRSLFVYFWFFSWMCVWVCAGKRLCLCKSPQDLLSTIQETPHSVCQRISFALRFIAWRRRHLEAHTENTNYEVSNYCHFFARLIFSLQWCRASLKALAERRRPRMLKVALLYTGEHGVHGLDFLAGVWQISFAVRIIQWSTLTHLSCAAGLSPVL